VSKPRKQKKSDRLSSKRERNDDRETRSISRFAPPWAGILVLVATARITSTYGVLSRTLDEQAHIACGMEYLDKGSYTYEPQHPTLTRIMAAFLPYINGAHSWGYQNFYTEGGAVLYRGGNYERTLEQARTGILPFFWISCLVVYLGARRYFDAITALIAVAIFSFTPTVLAHAGLATTDMGLAALFGACLLSTCVLAEHPNWGNGAIFGITLGLAICSKFSFLPFYGSCLILGLLAYLVSNRPSPGHIMTTIRAVVLPAALGIVVAFLTVWTIYRFSVGTSPLTGTMQLPFPELIRESIR
jgi:hypothetical protein